MFFDLRDDDAVVVEIWGSSLKGINTTRNICPNCLKFCCLYDKVFLSTQCSFIVLGRILFGRSMLDLITEITAITGRMKSLPQWTQQGAVAGLEGGTEVTLNTNTIC